MWMKSRLLFFILLCFFLVFRAATLSLGQAEQPAGGKDLKSASPPGSTANKSAPLSENSKYAGSETCKTCH